MSFPVKNTMIGNIIPEKEAGREASLSIVLWNGKLGGLKPHLIPVLPLPPSLHLDLSMSFLFLG